MVKSGTSWRQFFEKYAKDNTEGNINGIAEHYADSFITAGPTGSAAYKNNAAFLKWLEQLIDFNKQSGMESMTVQEVKETPISEHYTMVTVTWNARFQKTGDTPAVFDISYIIQLTGDKPEIVMYVSHKDQAEEMRRLGLL